LVVGDLQQPILDSECIAEVLAQLVAGEFWRPSLQIAPVEKGNPLRLGSLFGRVGSAADHQKQTSQQDCVASHRRKVLGNRNPQIIGRRGTRERTPARSVANRAGGRETAAGVARAGQRGGPALGASSRQSGRLARRRGGPYNERS